MELRLRYKRFYVYLWLLAVFSAITIAVSRKFGLEWIAYIIVAAILVSLLLWLLKWQRFGAALSRTYNAKEYKETIKLCQSKLTKADEYPSIYLFLASAYQHTDKIESALQMCNAFLEREPKSIRGHLTRAVIKFNLNKVDSGVSDCTAVLKFLPHNSAALVTRAHGLTRLKKIKEAELDLDEATKWSKSAQTDSLIHSNRARISLIRGNTEKALKLANEAVETSPNFSPVLGTRGLILTRLGRLDEALKDLSKAIELEPERKENYWFRAELFTALKESDKAASDKEIALSSGYQPYL